jgi:excisionase family DNA binding protein
MKTKTGRGKQGMVMLISRREAARRLGISTVTLYRHIQSGRITSIKLGKFVRFREADIERFIKRCERKPKAGHGMN